MDVQNSKMGMGISALVLASVATLTLEHHSAFGISIGTATLLILPWLFARKKPLIGYKIAMQNAYMEAQPRPSTSLPTSNWTSPIKHYDEELNALLDLALAHVLRNTSKMKETCKTEQKHLYEMQQTVKSLQLAALKQCDLSHGNCFIDERLNYLDYHADKMVLLIGKFSGVSRKLEEIANQANTTSSLAQIETVKSAQTEALQLGKLLSGQLSEFASFNKNYRRDIASRIIERCGNHLQIIQETLKADSDTLLSILKAATCIRADIAKSEFNPSRKGLN